MPRLRPPYTDSVQIPAGATSAQIPILNNDGQTIWVVEQISVTYSNSGDQVNASVIQSGIVATGGSLFPSASGLTQTFNGDPPLYVESYTNQYVLIGVTTIGGALGGLASIFVLYREIGYDDDELQGRY